VPRPINRLHQLLNQNRHTRRPVNELIVRNAAANTATLYFYDPIVATRDEANWYGGICPQDMVPAIHELQGVTELHLRIDCPGGDVFGAESIIQAFREWKSATAGNRIVGHVDGLAASAATGLCCVCDEVMIAPKGMYMIHQAWTYAWGNADQMRATAALLDKVDGAIIDEYVAFVGDKSSRDDITSWVKAETWFSASEAVAAGFAHSVTTAQQSQGTAASNSVTPRAWKLEAYAHAPAALLGQSPPPPADPPPQPSNDAGGLRVRQQQRMRALGASLAPA
jgi:ATP-dependent Clp protease, protease subunit